MCHYSIKQWYVVSTDVQFDVECWWLYRFIYIVYHVKGFSISLPHDKLNKYFGTSGWHMWTSIFSGITFFRWQLIKLILPFLFWLAWMKVAIIYPEMTEWNFSIYLKVASHIIHMDAIFFATVNIVSSLDGLIHLPNLKATTERWWPILKNKLYHVSCLFIITQYICLLNLCRKLQTHWKSRKVYGMGIWYLNKFSI